MVAWKNSTQEKWSECNPDGGIIEKFNSSLSKFNFSVLPKKLVIPIAKKIIAVEYIIKDVLMVNFTETPERIMQIEFKYM